MLIDWIFLISVDGSEETINIKIPKEKAGRNSFPFITKS